ncbi:copper chaperone PCu(A)C [Brevundimonas basaltis]|uniref:Copper(I)-binding protein n=1 Tax=Brevundimonas basaltis TaxID=472166 RepID=A0A7W8MI00_9CAUL|nr:copper chaperone PCu(A)C [Brevundimonas basaltis]MBB5292486.1 copper(I)-binding protein [Brevundimonas basaltis]
MSRALYLVLAALALAACTPGQPAQQGDAAATVQASGAVCRPTPTGRQMTGCYVTVTAPADDRLISVSSPVAGRAEIHESRIENNMMIMYELRDGLALPAGQAVELKPGGSHIMLLAVTEPLKAGDSVPLTLTFATAAPVEITAPVGQPALTKAGDAAH